MIIRWSCTSCHHFQWLGSEFYKSTPCVEILIKARMGQNAIMHLRQPQAHDRLHYIMIDHLDEGLGEWAYWFWTLWLFSQRGNEDFVHRLAFETPSGTRFGIHLFWIHVILFSWAMAHSRSIRIIWRKIDIRADLKRLSNYWMSKRRKKKMKWTKNKNKMQ